MNLIDALALWGRKFEPVATSGFGRRRFTLGELMQLFDRHAILELTPYVQGKALSTLKPDPIRKIKVSLLDDGISAIQSDSGDWYEVYRTAPSGDCSRVRIIAYSPAGSKMSEIRMVVGRRSYEHYFEEDPILDALRHRGEQA